mgnify:CR=1 FL=1
MSINKLLNITEKLIEERTSTVPKGRVKMLCVGIRKKEILIGENKYIYSKQIYYNYPKFCNIHAELDFFYKAKKNNFFADDILIIGKRTKPLKTTKPCIYCATVLSELKFKRIHFFENSALVSMSRKDFIESVNFSFEFKEYQV